MNSQLKTPWKKVIAVSPLHNFSLELQWEDGKKTRLCLDPRIYEKDIFWRLRNPRYFAQVSVDPLGGICWPEGEDLSPNFLSHNSVKNIVTYQ
ncbi:conserved hypothetical protein [Desulfamplus magnetovallimortis]|uniref:DUF2442 domain-containing protein n=1 Tax=Desulfamplus magnetovallimortis TaxID=1246637 RepID=A0A1W1HL00_9BACT|nr:DUF2442 domain-containing protein [Desulfamplus magnetovallimortis]SLM33171.1 conserved hypothetical protein [Desulfamplus magnetovallimortis]